MISGAKEPQAVNVALLPCPFCQSASAPKLKRWDMEPAIPGFYVVCDAAGWEGKEGRGCGCSGAYGETEAEAISAWNRRATPSLPRDAAAQVKRLDLCANQLEALIPDEMPCIDLYYALKKEGEPGWTYRAVYINVVDIRSAISLLLSQSAALASAREVIGDIEDYIANAQSHYATLFDRGQGIHGQPGYVVDAVWNAWTGKRLLADELSRAISDIRAAREWKER